MKILRPDTANFRPYGKLIHYPNIQGKGKVRNLWRIVHTAENDNGWRVAYLILRDKTAGRFECHPDSDETFEPVKGRAIMFVSLKRDLRSVKCFKVDKPFILRKGVWHALIALDPQAEIKITENAKLKCRYWNLGFRFSGPGDLEQRIQHIERV